MADKQENKSMTRAQKTEGTKQIVKEVLAVKFMRHNELIDEVAKVYVTRHEGGDAENINDVRGRVGSVLDIMKKNGEVSYDGGMYALKARIAPPPAEKSVAEEEEKPAPKKRGRKVKTAEEKPVEEQKIKEVAPIEEKKKPAAKRTKKTAVKAEEPNEEESKEPAPKKRGRKTKGTVETPAENKAEENATSLPQKEEEKPAPILPEAKTKAKTEAKAEEKPVEEEKSVEKEKSVEEEKLPTTPAPVPEKKENSELIVKPRAEIAQKGVVMDMSFLFGDTAKKTERKEPAAKTPEVKPAVKAEVKRESAPKTEVKPVAKGESAPKTPEVKLAPKAEAKRPAAKAAKQPRATTTRKAAEKPMTAEEKLKESFLKRMRTLGGDYFEYYSVYLLERYSMKNGRRLEGLSISGGDHDGGIDGEIVLTDKLGFKETIYIQSKNWDPEKGKEENWVVGETLLQQFIGACACRQAKEGKQHCRGIFITTSRFTPDATRILDSMSDKVIGYDGNDLFEAAKECSFGIIKKNGEWVLDDNLLSGTKAFFQML